MKRLLLPLLCLACACLPTSISAQTTTDAAKEDGKAFGRDKAAAAQSAATTAPDATCSASSAFHGGLPTTFRPLGSLEAKLAQMLALLMVFFRQT
tara:strand:+ start:193 stop:477 length:285 start_codon:yes stop_codon:yes gene_type:complete